MRKLEDIVEKNRASFLKEAEILQHQLNIARQAKLLKSKSWGVKTMRQFINKVFNIK